MQTETPLQACLLQATSWWYVVFILGVVGKARIRCCVLSKEKRERERERKNIN